MLLGWQSVKTCYFSNWEIYDFKLLLKTIFNNSAGILFIENMKQHVENLT